MCRCCFAVAADLINVFEVFLPQLLLYPNPTDPLNGEAAALLMREPAKYNMRVKGVLVGPLIATLGRSLLTQHFGVCAIAQTLSTAVSRMCRLSIRLCS